MTGLDSIGFRGSAFTPQALADAQQRPLELESRDSAARARIADCDERIDRLLTSVEDGMPRDWITKRVLVLRDERERLERMLPDRAESRKLSPGEIRAISEALGGVVAVLDRATPEERAAIYEDLAVTLTYNPKEKEVRATAELSRVARRVEGGV